MVRWYYLIQICHFGLWCWQLPQSAKQSSSSTILTAPPKIPFWFILDPCDTTFYTRNGLKIHIGKSHSHSVLSHYVSPCFKKFANFQQKIPPTKHPFAWGGGVEMILGQNLFEHAVTWLGAALFDSGREGANLPPLQILGIFKKCGQTIKATTFNFLTLSGPAICWLYSPGA